MSFSTNYKKTDVTMLAFLLYFEVILKVLCSLDTDITYKQNTALQGFKFSAHQLEENTKINTLARCARFCWFLFGGTSCTFSTESCVCYGWKFNDLTYGLSVPDAQYYDLKTTFIDCNDILNVGESGVYRIFPQNEPDGKQVFCDMETDGGGWTVILRRKDGSVDFSRTWDEFEFGFGNSAEEFYLGNHYIHHITNQANYELRVDVKNAEGDAQFALFDHFSIGPADTKYELRVYGYDSDSTAGDSLTANSGFKFITKDDYGSNDCPIIRSGAWWHDRCGYANLNGLYLTPGTVDVNGVRWDTFVSDTSLLYADMKIRRMS